MVCTIFAKMSNRKSNPIFPILSDFFRFFYFSQLLDSTGLMKTLFSAIFHYFVKTGIVAASGATEIQFARKGKEAKDDSGPVRSCLWGNCPNGGTKDMASHLKANT